MSIRCAKTHPGRREKEKLKLKFGGGGESEILRQYFIFDKSEVLTIKFNRIRIPLVSIVDFNTHSRVKILGQLKVFQQWTMAI
jgi:hypothetical protein